MIPFLNEAGRLALPVASSMLWQTAVLVMALLLVEVLAGRRLRATLRCGLWLLVIVKLLLPPSLKSPLSPGYWIGRWITPPLALPAASTATTIPQVNPVVSALTPFPRVEASEASEMPAVDRTVSGFPRLNEAGVLMGLWILGSVALACGVLRRNQLVRRLTGTARPASADLLEALRSAAAELGLRRLPELRLTQADHSPAVSGFLHPVIVLPAELAAHLTPSALRDVLLHELIHVRRRDLWLNLPQALVQIVWWWNPFVWLANARIRLLREQAVDEQVMLLTHGEEESTYPATLVAVARYCADRPVLTLSFVGILESRHHLRSRVERLLNAPLPPRAGLGRLGWLTLLLTACLALPMAFARRVDPSGPGVELSPRVYRFDPDRLTAALEERVSYTVEDFSVDDLPSNHGGDYTGGPGSFISGTGGKHIRMESRIRPLLGKYFAAEGVTFAAPNQGSPSLHEKSFSFNASTGTLIVAASDAELAAVDKALRGLSVPPVTIPPAASSPPLPSNPAIPVSEAEGASNLPQGTQFQANVVGYVSRPAENKESAPKFYVMDPILAHRYGLILPPSAPTNSHLPAALSQPEAGRSVHAMDPELARRYGLVPKDPQRTTDSQNESPPKFFAMDPTLARRYGLIPPTSTPTNSTPPAAVSKPEVSPSVYAMDPVLARRYGLIPKDSQQATGSQQLSSHFHIRIIEVSEPGGLALSFNFMEMDTDRAVISGIEHGPVTEQRLAEFHKGGSERVIADFERTIPSGRRVDIAFDEVPMLVHSQPSSSASSPNQEIPSLLEMLPTVKLKDSTIELAVVVRRHPDDPNPVQQRAKVVSGDSLVLVLQPMPSSVSAQGRQTSLFLIVTPTLVDSPSAANRK